MGLNDHMPDEDEFVGIAVQAGALEVCPLHKDVTINRGDPEANSRAYAMATNRWKAGELLGEREDIMAGIKDALDMAADDGCPACAGLADA